MRRVYLQGVEVDVTEESPCLIQSLLDECPSAWSVSLHYEPEPVVRLTADPRTILCPVEVSRHVAQFFGTSPYTVELRYGWSDSTRIDSIVRSLTFCEGRPMPEPDTPPFLYVIFGHLKDKRVPFGSFPSREGAESAVENGALKNSMARHGLKLEDCDHYTVERWEVGRFLEDPYVKTLTSYNKRGQVMMRFQDSKSKSPSKKVKVSGRLASILDSESDI